jgi:hypothetical protein
LNVVIPIDIELTSEQNFANLLEKILMGGKMFNADGATCIFAPATRLNTSLSTAKPRIALTVSDDKSERFASIQLHNADGTPADGGYAAAHATLHMESINVEDEDDLDRFPGTKAFETQAGYRTVSLLTLPLVNSERQVIGVLQYVNAKHQDTGDIIPFSPNLQHMKPRIAGSGGAEGMCAKQPCRDHPGTADHRY